jgi:hypothetical protein
LLLRQADICISIVLRSKALSLGIHGESNLKQQLDSHATTKLQQWLKTRPNPLNREIQPVLEQLHEFAWQAHSKGFDATLKQNLNIPTEGTTAIQLFESIADWLSRGIRPSERAIVMKSLQEALFLCTEVESDNSPSQLGKRLESYLALSGSKGLIRLFLSLHISNLIFMDLHRSLQTPDGEVFENRINEIERLCQTAAGLSVRSWEKWPTLTDVLMSSAAQTLGAALRTAINPKVRTVRPSS